MSIMEGNSNAYMKKVDEVALKSHNAAKDIEQCEKNIQNLHNKNKEINDKIEDLVNEGEKLLNSILGKLNSKNVNNMSNSNIKKAMAEHPETNKKIDAIQKEIEELGDKLIENVHKETEELKKSMKHVEERQKALNSWPSFKNSNGRGYTAVGGRRTRRKSKKSKNSRKH